MRKKRRKQNKLWFVLLASSLLLAGGMLALFGKELGLFQTKQVGKPEITEAFLSLNRYSRPGDSLDKVNAVVVHYTANPGTDAVENRNYFEGLKDTKETYASSHFVIGLDGTILQCIPLDEISYASNERNVDTVSIECCHPKKNGKFKKETYQSLVWLVSWLCGEYNLTEKDVIRHYDVTGKLCPLYFVKHEDAWKAFRKDVKDYIEKNGNKKD